MTVDTDTFYHITDVDDESDLIFSMLTGTPLTPLIRSDCDRPLKSCMKSSTLDDSLSSLSSHSSSSGRSHSVSFDTVEIREHQMILDESVPGPAALTIAWEATDTDVTTVQDYECNRSTFNTRSLTPMERAAILMNAGYSLQELKFRSPDILKEVMHRGKKRGIVKNKPLISRSVYYKVKKAAKKLVGGAPRAA